MAGSDAVGGSVVDASGGHAGSAGNGGEPAIGGGGMATNDQAKGSFFVTSTGSGTSGGDLGGLEGADARCVELATAVGLGGKEWRAYLSTSAIDGVPAVNARDRIGSGPWYNVTGVLIAADIEALHSDAAMFTVEITIDEQGQVVPFYESWDPPVFGDHDILTGSNEDGTALPAGQNATCGNWTSQVGRARVGHHDRLGPLDRNPSADSWNDAHFSEDCTPAGFERWGGSGRTYCFALSP